MPALLSHGLSGAALLVAMAPPAIAGEAAPPAASGADDIVVTAQRRTQTASSLGLAITAVSGETLVEKGITSAEELWKITPGLVVKDSGYGVPNYTLRGVGFENYFVNSSSTVGIYANEIAIPYPAMSRGSFFDLERVEVLKGPQGDLYGRNTTAGQINLIDRKPTRDVEAGGSLEGGSYSQVNARGYLSGPLADNVQGRLAFAIDTSDGWQHSLSRPTDKPLGAKNEVALRGQINVDLGPDSSLLLRGYWNRDRSDNEALTPVDGRTLGLASAQARATTGTVIFSTGDNRAADWSPDFRPHRDNTAIGTSATLNLARGGVKLTAISAFDSFRRYEVNDWDGAAADDSNATNASRITAFSQEVRLANRSADAPVQWIAGTYFSWDRVHEDYRFYMSQSYYATALGIDALNTRYTQTTRSIAGFGHVEARLADRFHLVGGLRYTHETRSFAGCTYDLDGSLANFTNNILIPRVIKPAGLPVPANITQGGCSVYDDRPASPTYGTFSDAPERLSTGRWMWKGGAQFDAARDVLVYANVSSGFKSGGFNGSNANLKSQESGYSPEELTAYETGVKANLRRAHLYIDSSFFYYDYRNKQTNGVAVTFVGNITGITNIPRSRVFGIDSLVRWTPLPGLSLQASGTYLDSRILRWQPVSSSSAYPTVLTYNAAGLPLPNTPRWSLSLTPSYTFKVSHDRQVKLALDYYYRSSTSGIGNVYQNIPGYDLVNAEISIAPRNKRWDLTLWTKNLFNRYYYNYAGLPGNADYVRLVGQPITFGVRLGFAL
ncbi:MAG TPA: TonB-dependent receptor [Novosphingobium sp.]|nr:TonB-dependent receptor [Novosphingobium sp.]HZV09386.1 TonB-dependent receptor [Novosphingobium sp.]